MTNATLRPYHTDFYRWLTVCYGQPTYGAEVPSTPGPTCLTGEIVGLPTCSVTVAQFVCAPPPGSCGETSPVHGPKWLPSGWWRGQRCVVGFKLPSRVLGLPGSLSYCSMKIDPNTVSFPRAWALMLLYMTLQCLFGLTHIRFLTVWFPTANPVHHVWPFVLWCYVFHSHKTIPKFITRAEGCWYSELGVHFINPFRHPGYVRMDCVDCFRPFWLSVLVTVFFSAFWNAHCG